jgi:outer membrane protein TolC
MEGVRVDCFLVSRMAGIPLGRCRDRMVRQSAAHIRFQPFRACGFTVCLGLLLMQPALSAAQTHPSTASIPQHITLAEAEARAKTIEPTWIAQQTARGSAVYSRRAALAALLPQASFHGEALYTQPNGIPDSGPLPGTTGPVFIANNSVHEYISQGLVTSKLSLAGVAHYKQTSALAAQAQAEAEIAQRGLHATVTLAYYSELAAEHKLSAAQQAEQEAGRFVELTRKLEAGREVAHADVLKAELQQEQRQRDMADAQQALLTARESLGVLLFPDPSTPYTLDDTLNTKNDVPAETQVRALATQSNPVLRSAWAALRAAKQDTRAAWAEYLPSFTLNYNYGIDAPAFAANGPGGRQYLGYSIGAGIDLPLWNWFRTQDQVEQSKLHEQQAQAALDYAQRQSIAALDASYGELKTAAAALASLKTSVTQAQQSLRLTTERYQAGEANVLEVVDAQNTYLAAESAVADGAVRLHVARANLERWTGPLP